MDAGRTNNMNLVEKILHERNRFYENLTLLQLWSGEKATSFPDFRMNLELKFLNLIWIATADNGGEVSQPIKTYQHSHHRAIAR